MNNISPFSLSSSARIPPTKTDQTQNPSQNNSASSTSQISTLSRQALSNSFAGKEAFLNERQWTIEDANSFGKKGADFYNKGLKLFA